MTIVVSDSFDRADSSTTLGNADTGQTWTNLITGTAWGISSNQAYCPDPSNAGTLDANVVVDAGIADCVIECDFPTVRTDNFSPGLVFRATDGANLFNLICRDDGLARIYKRQAGGSSQILGLSGSPIASGDHVKITLQADSIKVAVNGTNRGSVTSTFNQTATSHGLFSGDAVTTARWDNFTVSTLVLNQVKVRGFVIYR